MHEPPKTISKQKLLLVEGADAKYFWIWALLAYSIEDVDILDFGGVENNDLALYLQTLMGVDGFENVKSIVIARDAESNPAAAVTSVKSNLIKSGLSAPDSPFVFTLGTPRIAFMLFPGYSNNNGQKLLKDGTLEDLCLELADNGPVMECVQHFLDCLHGHKITITRPHKVKLHAYLSGSDKYVGLKIGEAAKVGAWKWDSPILLPFREIIEAM